MTEENTTEQVHFQFFKCEFQHLTGPLIVILWILIGIISKLVFNLSRKVSHIFPDSSLLLVLGLVVGCVLHYTTPDENDMYVLNSGVFFHYLLPPIVLDAGYFMPNRLLFLNIGTVVTFAVIGTVANMLLIGLSLWGCGFLIEYLPNQGPLDLIRIFLFTSLISAVDPVAVLAVFEEIQVNKTLYISVFGESLFNDAVTMVLYHMMQSYYEIKRKNDLSLLDMLLAPLSFIFVSFGGIIVGLISAFIASFATRFTDNIRLLEPLLVLSLAYASYLIAEGFELSSILAYGNTLKLGLHLRHRGNLEATPSVCLRTGKVVRGLNIVSYGQFVRQYVSLNLDPRSKTTLNYFIKTLSNCSETIIFIYLGLSAWKHAHVWSFAFIGLTLLFCLIFRATCILIQCYFLNKGRLPESKFSFAEQIIMAYGGLRGAIAYGLAASITVHENNAEEQTVKDMFLTATIIVVIFTVFVQGTTIKPLVGLLKVEKQEERHIGITEKTFELLQDNAVGLVESVIGHRGHMRIMMHLDRFNEKILWKTLVSRKAKQLQSRTHAMLHKTIDNENRLADIIINKKSSEISETNDENAYGSNEPEDTSQFSSVFGLENQAEYWINILRMHALSTPVEVKEDRDISQEVAKRRASQSRLRQIINSPRKEKHASLGEEDAAFEHEDTKL